jgi:hypothetical protein
MPHVWLLVAALGDLQVLPTQTWPEGQALPHAPQLAASVVVSAQLEVQLV